jgi:predicted protein tyrosine phosphatase
MRIRHANRQQVRQLIGDSTCALISITVATGTHPDLIGTWGAVYRIKFDDVDRTNYQQSTMTFKLFSEEQADGILDFVIAADPPVLVINCDAGMSRSTAVMVALEQIFNKKVIAGNWPLHNRWVATTLLKAAHKRGLI